MLRLLLCLSLLLPSLGAQEAPLVDADLERCYAWAKERSESLRLREEQVRQLEQQFRQALAGALPSVSFNASDKWLDKSGAAGGGVTVQSPQPQVNLSLSQTLFSGLREYAAMAAAKHLGRAAELQLQRARAALFRDVSGAFYLTVSLETQLADTQAAVALSADRVRELRERVALGRSRRSEVVLVESQLASLQAQAETQKGQIAVARELLSFLTGQELARTALRDRLERLRAVEPEEALLARAQERSDVQALRKTVLAQEAGVRATKGAWWPTVSLTGNYYLKRMPALDPIKWDIGVAGSLPLFAGGGQLAAVRLADSQLEAARWAYELGLRQARSDIRSAAAALRAAVAVAETSEKAYLKAEEAHRLVVQEYRLGLVNNLDVLSAMNSLVAAKSAFDASVVQAKLELLRLKVSTEELP
ncbi:MAG: TolC family protein [Elusimicrobia bacterium]|nr:TolC family protein [Elusimicrobiota bacterium]